MKKRVGISLTGVAVAMLVVVLFPVPSEAQTATSRPNVGNPSLSGVWVTKYGKNTSCDMEDVNSDGCGVGGRSEPKPSQSRVADPPDGKIPYLPWAKALQQENRKNYTNPKVDEIDLSNRCISGGVTRAFTHSPIQIIQIPGNVVILFENKHGYRVIPLDGRPHVAKGVPLWMGDSVGRWEGNTLVVDVTNLNRRVWFDAVGNFHSDAVHIVERFTTPDPNTINYEATINDPSVYSRPWKLAIPLVRETGNEGELMEWACHEGERSSKNIVNIPGN